MVTAFVLISVEDRKVHETVKALIQCKGVTEIHVVGAPRNALESHSTFDLQSMFME